MPRLFRPRKLIKQKRPLRDGSWQIMQEVDQILVDRDRRQKLGYAAIRKKLNAVPRPERGIDWTERVIALYCAFEMRAGRCGALKVAIHDARQERGEVKEWDAFNDRMRAVIAPKVLTIHGLQLPFANRDQAEIARDLGDLFALLDSLGYQAFMNSGTLLGAVREGSFLGHDDDADLAVLLEGETDRDVIDALGQLHDALNASGKLRQPAFFHKRRPILKVKTGSGVEVDLFALWLRDGKAYIWPHTFGELTEQDIFPLTTQTLCGAQMPAPRNAEKMLALNYGENWRFPDPDYVFPWDAAEIRFASFLDAYMRRRNPYDLRMRLNAWRRGRA